MVHIEGLSVKLRKQLLEAETEYQLRSEQLNDYSKLIEDPQELIIKLYSDMEKPAVCEFIENASLDLHHACDRIAQRYGLEINDIRKMLFQEWMRLPTDAISSTETTLPSMRFHVII
jgi:hypothetical protein